VISGVVRSVGAGDEKSQWLSLTEIVNCKKSQRFFEFFFYFKYPLCCLFRRLLLRLCRPERLHHSPSLSYALQCDHFPVWFLLRTKPLTCFCKSWTYFEWQIPEQLIVSANRLLQVNKKVQWTVPWNKLQQFWSPLGYWQTSVRLYDAPFVNTNLKFAWIMQVFTTEPASSPFLST
jgi:hypothetical protein